MAGEMTQRLRALVALPEDPGSILSTHMVAPGNPKPSPGHTAPSTHRCIDTHATKAHTVSHTA